MELKIKEYQLPQKIDFNFEEIKVELIEKVNIYETMVYDDSQIKEAKTDRANLNKFKKALNDERIKREKEYLVPFNEFKAQVNELIGIIDKPINMIDKQVKEYEEKQKENKKNDITKYWYSIEHPTWLTLDRIFDERWLNASTTMKSIKDNIDGWINKINTEIRTLEGLPAFSFEAIEEYKRNGFDLNKAIDEGKRLNDIQKRKEEQEKLKNEEPPKEVLKPSEIPMVEKPKEEGKWINFSAKLTVEQAKDLKQFFELRNIEFKAI